MLWLVVSETQQDLSKTLNVLIITENISRGTNLTNRNYHKKGNLIKPNNLDMIRTPKNKSRDSGNAIEKFNKKSFKKDLLE